jgi:hypothetical protein
MDSKLKETKDKYKDVVKFVNELYNVIMKDSNFKSIDPDDRHQILFDKYANFAQAYPIVLRIMAINLLYYEKAFVRFLWNMDKYKHGGMEGFISSQADYAKYLYIEDSKHRTGHYSADVANEVWKFEYDNMYKFVKEIRNIEKETTEEFEKDKQETLEYKRAELLEFLEVNGEPEPKDDMIERYDYLMRLEDELLKVLEEKNDLYNRLSERSSNGKDWIADRIKKF